MPEITQSEIDHLALLARVTLSAKERKQFSEQLPAILDFINQLNAAAKLSFVSDETEPIKVANLRPDQESGSRLSLSELAKLAPAWRDEQLEVPAFFGGAEDE